MRFLAQALWGALLMPLLLCAAEERVFTDAKVRIVVRPLSVEERFRKPIEVGEDQLIQVAPKRGWFLVVDEVNRPVAPDTQSPELIPKK